MLARAWMSGVAVRGPARISKRVVSACLPERSVGKVFDRASSALLSPSGALAFRNSPKCNTWAERRSGAVAQQCVWKEQQGGCRKGGASNGGRLERGAQTTQGMRRGEKLRVFS